jgi:hypothetical protein
MANPMGAFIELWPLMADDEAIWKVSPGLAPWTSALPVMSDTDPNFDADQLLYLETRIKRPPLIHSTSWRPKKQRLLLTYMAVVAIEPDTPVLQLWPEARVAISRRLLRAYGPPIPHAAWEAPSPRPADVLVHGIRHLRFMQEFGTPDQQRVLSTPHWAKHLELLKPALAGYYSEAA